MNDGIYIAIGGIGIGFIIGWILKGWIDIFNLVKLNERVKRLEEKK